LNYQKIINTVHYDIACKIQVFQLPNPSTPSYTNKQHSNKQFLNKQYSKLQQNLPIFISRNWVEILAPNFGNVNKLCI
jgi:hypothetical protein